jgi:hypothetical protein
VYLQYKDVALLERHYPAMAAYMDYVETTIDPKTGKTLIFCPLSVSPNNSLSIRRFMQPPEPFRQ